MAAKKKAASTKRKAAPAEYNRQAPRHEAWSADWVKLLDVAGGPHAFAQELGISYQSVYRFGVLGDQPGRGTAFMIRNWAAMHNLKSPV